MKLYDCKYLLHVLEEIKRRELIADGKLIIAIDDFIKRTQKNLVHHVCKIKSFSKYYTEYYVLCMYSFMF